MYSTVLIAEDFEPFRYVLSSLLLRRLYLRIVDEVADGLYAVERAGELHPDLILLDIGLPRLNGIAAAREIKELSPHSKIIFVSQHTQADVVQEALATGATAYVVKSDVGSELLIAIDAALRGKQFLSRSIAGCRTTKPWGID